MVFSLEFSILLNTILESKKIREHMTIFTKGYTIFTMQELSHITELELENERSIKDLDKLPNLRILHINSHNYTQIMPEFPYMDSNGINHIDDFSVISKLSSLEELTIENDLYVEELDLTTLEKLQKLVLINNPKLKTLKGLDTLKSLKHVVMYGNNIKNFINPIDYAQNTIMADTNILDISMYLPMIAYSRKNAKRLKDYDVAGYVHFHFAEKSGFLDYTEVSPQELCDMFSKLDIFFTTKGIYQYSNTDKISFVYYYLIRHIQCSLESIEKRNEEYQRTLQIYSYIPEQKRESLSSIHSGYRTYYFRRGNCEGVINLGIFMLEMLGVEAHNVHVHDKRGGNKSFGNNHSVMRVFLDGKYYYCDPNYDRKEANRYFMMSYDQIDEIHQLDSFEKQLSLESEKENHKG